MRLLAEVTLTLVLFTDAARIDMTALRHEYAVPLRLLGIGLPLTIIAGWALAVVDFSGFSVAEALVLPSSWRRPTPLSASRWSADEFPSGIRQGLNVESGLNDGLCVPLLFIAIGLAGTEADVESTPTAIRVVCEKAIGYGVLFGILAGATGGLLLR